MVFVGIDHVLPVFSFTVLAMNLFIFCLPEMNFSAGDVWLFDELSPKGRTDSSNNGITYAMGDGI
jgi:hypothetical protein